MNLFWNFVKAWAHVQWARIRGYEVLAEPAIANLRFRDGCQQCPFFDGAQCDVCGCLAMAKTMIAVEKCPVGTWGPVWVKRTQRRAERP